jgi:hypothetical protein
MVSRSPMENHKDWLRSIEVYSNRSMTKTGDKLPTISGYAHEVHKSIGGPYLAGLWERYLAFGLLWVPHRNRYGQSISRQQRAPSWSWASVDSEVSYFWPVNRIIESFAPETTDQATQPSDNACRTRSYGRNISREDNVFWIPQKGLLAFTSRSEIRRHNHIERYLVSNTRI